MTKLNGMTFINDRKEIAHEINISGTPVITMDISESMNGYEHCYKGSKIRIRDEKSGLDIRCTARMYGDEAGNEYHAMPYLYKKIKLIGELIGIHSGFGASDVDEMIEWSNTRLVNPGDKVLVWFRGKDTGFLRVMRIGTRIDKFCSTVTILEDIDE